MKIKICGLMRPQDIAVVNVAQPDYIGFVFAESRRQVTPEQAAELKKMLCGNIKAVGVFVNNEIDTIARICGEGVIELVQLHGDEDADFITRLREKIDCPIIKALRVLTAQQVLAAEALPCDYLLLDTYNKDTYGGTGEAFDHELIPVIDKPFFLAGGLNAETITDASARGPYCLDVSSGVETNGVKDAQKIKDIIQIVREEC